MTDATPPMPEPTTPVPPTAPPIKPKKKRRTWKQRFKILFLLALIAVGLFRISLNFLLPTVIDRVAGMFGFDCGYQRLDLSFLGGTAHVWGLQVRPKGGGNVIATADYIEGNLSPLELLRGRLVVFRAEVDGADITIERAADGSLPLLKPFLAANPNTAPAAAATTKPSGAPQSLSFAAPLRVDAVRLSHLTAHLLDRSVTPTFEATVRTGLRVSDVGAPGEPTKFELDVGVDPLLDTFHVQGEARTAPDARKIDLTAQVRLRGLHPKAAAGYLAPLGLRAIADGITAQANVAVSVVAIPHAADFSATVAVDQVSAVADGQQWASLGTLRLDAKHVSAAGVELGTLFVADGFASAERTADGNVRFAGLELTPVASVTPAATSQPAASVAVTSGPPFHFSLDTLDLRRLQANVTDNTVRPAAPLVARLDLLQLQGIDSARAAGPVPLTLSAALPGVLRSVVVQGTVTPFAAAKSIALRVDARGIRPDLLRPYMDRFGIVSRLTDARLAAGVAATVTPDVSGTIRADAAVTDVHFDDGNTSLAQMKRVQIDGLSFTPSDGSTAVKSISISGPNLRVVREADGRLAAAGFKLVPPSPTPQQAGMPATSLATPASTPAGATFALPRVAVGHLRWDGIHLVLVDAAAMPPTTFTFEDAGVELDDLLVDLKSTAAARPGKFTAWLAAPSLARNLAAHGTFTPDPGRFTFDAEASGDGLTGERIAPYLRGLGIEPTLIDGRLHAHAKAVLTQNDNGLGVDLDLNDATYADGPTELLGVDALHLGGLTIGRGGVALNELRIARPRVRVARENSGVFRAGGVRLVGALPATQPADVRLAPPSTQPTSLALRPLPFDFALNRLQVDDAAVDWSDAAAAAPVDVHAVASVGLTDIRLGPATRPATLHASASVDGALRRGTVDGTLTLSPVAPAIDVRVVADGLAAGPLAAYLPPAIQATLKDGHFETHVAASVGNSPGGGLSARLAVNGLKFSEPGPAAPDAKSSPDAPLPALFDVDAFELAATRIDSDAGVFNIDRLTSAGVAVNARLREDGTIDACGVHLVNPPPTAPPATAPAAAPAAPTGPVASLATLVGDARRPLPELNIGTLDVGVRRIGLAGFTGAGGRAIALENLRLQSPGPLSIGGRRTADDRVQLRAVGAVDPLLHWFDVSVDARPLANEPSVSIDVAAFGIQGQGLTDLVPALRPLIDGSPLTDGNVRTHVEAAMNYGRRGPRDFDVARGFTATLDVKPIEFRGTAGGPVLAGLASVHGEGIKVEPANGNVSIKTLDLGTPTGRIFRDDKGINVCGLVVRLAPQQPIETLAPATQPAVPAVAAAAPPPASPPSAQRPPNEIRLDHFTVSGVDALIEDRTTRPFTVIPLKSLDVDVRDLSNQLPWNGKPVRFNVLVTSDKIKLPPRKGITAARSDDPDDDRTYTEKRELFSQVTADGQIGFVRRGDVVALDGWTKTAVNGFELLGVRGLAKQYGVTIGGGAFDDINDARFRPDGPIETKTRLVFTNLSLSEPADGPLRRLLKLPAPIDVAIGAVTDPDGSITMNLPVPIKNGEISAGDIVGPAIGAVADVFITGIASAPLKAIGGVGDLLHLGGTKDTAPEAPVVITFLPAYDGLDLAGAAAVSQLVQQLKDDPTLEVQLRHTLTADDVSRAAVRANPTPEQCRALAAQVRQQKADLVRQHQVLAAQARGDLGAAATDRAAATLQSLRDVDAQLARAEDALDELYALTGTGAPAAADRRTRTASLEIGRRRLDAVRDAITRSGIVHVESRLHASNPQFDPTDTSGGGAVTIVLIRKKH